MSDRGFVIEQIVEDGACLFRSISLQIYGDQDMHEIIRQQTMDYIVSTNLFFFIFKKQKFFLEEIFENIYFF